MEKRKPNFIKAVVFTCFVTGILISGYALYDYYTDDYVKSWKTVYKWVPGMPLGEATPGAGNSGILEVFFINHSADKYYTNENTSATLEGHCTANGLGYADADNTEIDLAHSTTFDILVKVCGNATHCKHGATWYDSDLNVTITWSDKSMTTDQPDGNTTYPQADMNTSGFTLMYEIFYWDNSGSGYTINKGQTSEIASIEFAAYF